MSFPKYSSEPYVIIVGAGPSGLLLTLLLARLSSIPVLLLDQSSSLDTNPRATHYGGPAMLELRRAGLVEDMKSQGFIPDTVCWRKLDGTRIAGIGFGARSSEMYGAERIVCLPLNRLGEIMVGHLREYEEKGLVRVRWGGKVVRVGQDEGGAWVDVEVGVDGKMERLEAPYVVGCDGGNSTVRKLLFGSGDAGFPGKTWDEQIVATNTYYDFQQFGWEDSNFIIHPEHWYMAAKISTDGMWRVTYGELPGLTNDQLQERQPMKFEQMLPGHPKPGQYKVVNFSPYRVHQRLAPRMRVGRIMLAADAAHLCNPFGGMGLTSGIVDIGCLYDCLAGIHAGKVDPDFILEKYHEVRSQKFHEIINPISSANIVRLFGQNPETAGEKDDFLLMCKAAEKDEEMQKHFTLATMALCHDFKQYYRTEDRPAQDAMVEEASKGVPEAVVKTMPVGVSD